VDEGEFIGVGAEVGKEVGDHFSGFAARFEIPERFGDVSGGALEGDGGNAGRLLTVKFGEVGFVVEGVEVGDSAGAVDNEDSFCFGFKVAGSGEVGIVWVDVGANGGFAAEVRGVV